MVLRNLAKSLANLSSLRLKVSQRASGSPRGDSQLLRARLPPKHVYEVRPRKDRRGVDLISDVLPFGRLWYGEANAVSKAIGSAMHCSRSHDEIMGPTFLSPL